MGKKAKAAASKKNKAHCWHTARSLDEASLADVLSRLINDDDNSINAHVWVETANGMIVDAVFPELQRERRSLGLGTEKVYVEYPSIVQKGLWKHVWKRCIRPTVKVIKGMGFTEDEFWAEFLANPTYTCCMFNAYAYHRAHPNTSLLKFGALGYKKCGGSSKKVDWEFGKPIGAL